MKLITSPSGIIDGVLLSIHDKVTESSPRSEVVQLRWDLQSILDPISGKEGLYTHYENWVAENNAIIDAGLDSHEMPEELRDLDVLKKVDDRALNVIITPIRTLGNLAVTCDELSVIRDVDSRVAQKVSDGTAISIKKFAFAGEVISSMLSLIPQQT